MAVYEHISDSGFIVGRYDPHDTEPDLIDAQMVVNKSWDAIEKAKKNPGGGPQPQPQPQSKGFWAELGEEANKRLGYKSAPAAPPPPDKVAQYRQKRLDKIRMAQARKETRMPAKMAASELLPKSTAGKVALAAVPVALAVKYNQQASDAAESLKRGAKSAYGSSRDTRHYRPASPYFDDRLGKSAEDILDAWISKAGGATIPGPSHTSPSSVPPPPRARPEKFRYPSKRKIARARWQTGSAAATQGMKEPLELRAKRYAEKAGASTKDWFTAQGGSRTKILTHIGEHPGTYIPLGLGAGGTAVAAARGARQAKVQAKKEAIEAAARKVRNKNLMLAGAAAVPAALLLANKKPVEKSYTTEDLEKGLLSMARNRMFLREQARRAGAPMPMGMARQLRHNIGVRRQARKAGGAVAEQQRKANLMGWNAPRPPKVKATPAAPAPAPAPQKGFWDKLNEGSAALGNAARNVGEGIAGVRAAAGPLPFQAAKPATRMGLTRNQQLGLGAAGAAGLYAGHKLQQPRPARYQ